MFIVIRFLIIIFEFSYINATGKLPDASTITQPIFYDFFGGTSGALTDGRSSVCSGVPSEEAQSMDVDLEMRLEVGNPSSTHDAHTSRHGIKNVELAQSTQPSALPEPALLLEPRTGQAHPEKGSASSQMDSSSDRPLMRSQASANYPTIYQHQSLGTIDGYQMDPKRHFEAFWKPKIALVIPEVEKEQEMIQGPRVVNLEPDEHQKLKLNRLYPEEKILKKQFASEQRPNSYSMPFYFPDPNTRGTYEDIQRSLYSREKFYYNVNHKTVTSSANKIFRDANLEGKLELEELGLPASTLYKNALLPVPYVAPKQRAFHIRSSKRVELDFTKPRESIRVQKKSQTERVAISHISEPSAPPPISKKRKTVELPESLPSLDMAKMWIEYSVPAAVHLIRVLCEAFPDFAIKAKKTVRELQWDAWRFFYVLLNNLDELLRQDHSVIWNSRSAMYHSNFVRIIQSMCQKRSNGTSAYTVGCSMTSKILGMWLSCEHQDLFLKTQLPNQGLGLYMVALLKRVHESSEIKRNFLPLTPKKA